LASASVASLLAFSSTGVIVRCSNLGLPHEVGEPAVFAWQQVVGHCSHLMGCTGQ
jgi:hypothetical protein